MKVNAASRSAWSKADAIRAISDQPIHTIVNTHIHPDHTGGNLALLKLGPGGRAVRVMAHENVFNKMVAAAAGLLLEGSTLVVVAECPLGIGPGAGVERPGVAPERRAPAIAPAQDRICGASVCFRTVFASREAP